MHKLPGFERLPVVEMAGARGSSWTLAVCSNVTSDHHLPPRSPRLKYGPVVLFVGGVCQEEKKGEKGPAHRGHCRNGGRPFLIPCTVGTRRGMADGT